MKRAFVGIMALGTLLIGQQAQGTLIGDQIEIAFDGIGINEFLNIETVGVGPEVTSDDGSAIGDDVLTFDDESIDVGDSSITFVFNGPDFTDGDFFEFRDLDWVGVPGEIIGFSTIDGAGLNAGDVTFTANSVRIDTDSTTGAGTFVVNLDVRHNNDNAVPEPITVTLGLMGLGVLGMATRRRVA